MDIDTTTTPLPSNGQSVGHDKDDQPKIRISSSGGSFPHQSGLHVTINGLDSKELGLMEGAAHGHQWVTVSNHGRLRAIPTYKELPPPDEDEMMKPFWRPAVLGVETQMDMFDFKPKDVGFIPSIIIQHLCGYRYSSEGYTREAQKLQRYGFECLRSRRHSSGQYHEMWLLLSLHSADGSLKEAIEAVPSKPSVSYDHRRLETAISFLCRNVQFGTLDVTKQCAAAVID